MEKLTSMFHRILGVLKMATVEPILFLFALGGSTMWPTLQALIYRKVCLEKFNITICDNLHVANLTTEEDAVQTTSSYWFLVRIYTDEIPAIMASLFYGNLSDNVSRKTAILLPIVGQILANVIYLLNGIFLAWPVWVTVLGSVFTGTFGGGITLNLGVFSYISDVTDKDTRTVRMGLIHAAAIFGSTLGHFFSGKLLDMTSFSFVLALSTGIYVGNLLYIQYFVRNFDENYSSSADSKREILKNIFSPAKIKEGISVATRERPKNARMHIALLNISIFMAILGGSNSWLIGYLFLRRQPLSWTQSMYGYYVGLGHLAKGLAVLLILPLLKNILHVNDCLIAIVAAGLHVAAETVFGFSVTTWMVFTTIGIDVLHGTLGSCYRSMLSMLVEPHEYGRNFAVLGSLESISVLVASAVYNSVYPETLDIWAGMCFVIGAFIVLISMILLVIVYVDQQKFTSRGHDYQQINPEESIAMTNKCDNDDEQSLSGASNPSDNDMFEAMPLFTAIDDIYPT